MLYLIGLGLGDAEDITCKGLAVIRRASRVYLEAYTSILTVGTEALVSKTVVSGWYNLRADGSVFKAVIGQT